VIDRHPRHVVAVTALVSETLEAYVASLRDVFAQGLAGVYLCGSVAWGAYDPAVSDVDVAVLHRPDVTGEQRRSLAGLHQDFGRRYATVSRLDVSFVPLRFVGTYGEDALPYYRDGRFHPYGGGDVNMVMWHTPGERGIAVWGPPAAELCRRWKGRSWRRTCGATSRFY
jgi:predicted nucleotidyltransferase